MALVAISAKVEPEVKSEFERAFELSDAQTRNQFFEILLEAFLNPKTKEVEVPRPTAEQLEEIQLKENEIGRLKTAIDLETEKLKEENENLKGEITLKSDRITELENRPPEGVKIGENQVLVNLEPVISHVLNIEADVASRKGKGTFTRESILKNCFWETIKDGRYVPYKIWSDFEISKVIQGIKKSQEQTQQTQTTA
jgi:hypothetical protein